MRTLPWLPQENTYQALVITDTLWQSYAVFTYKCGLLEWSGDSAFEAVIGYSALGQFFEDHPLSQMSNTNDIACLNSPQSEWSNVVYNLTDLDDVPSPSTQTYGTLPQISSTMGVLPTSSSTQTDGTLSQIAPSTMGHLPSSFSTQTDGTLSQISPSTMGHLPSSSSTQTDSGG